MSRLEKLINELCPNGVEYKKLEEFIDYIQPTKYIVTDTNYDDKYETPVLTAGQTFILGYTNEETGIFNASKETPVIIFDDFTAGFHWVDFNFKVKSSAMKILFSKGNINFRYFYHIMGMINYCSNEHTRLWIGTYSKIEIPVPPLAIQEEIVRILDNFTELTAELTARKKQYEYYRDKLLTFENDIKIVKLKDIATSFYRGNGITRDQVTESGVPCVRYGEIYTTYNVWFDKCESHTNLSSVNSPKYINKGDLLFAITGESIEDIGKTVAYIGDEKCLAGGDILVMTHNQNPKYLAYALSTTKAVEQKGKGKVKSKVVHTNADSIGNIEIQLPSLEIQQRIVDVLDNFEAICSDLNIGLPAEIEARQKQYEYYRDLLLTFPENDFTIKQASKQASKQAITMTK